MKGVAKRVSQMHVGLKQILKKKRKVITRRYHQRHPDRRLLLEARKRAKRYGMRLNITIEDCAIPKICPVLGLPLRRGASGKVWAGSPTLDRIDSRKGYVKGNVIVVSKKANTIKSDATIAELQAVLNFYRTIGAP